MGVGTSDLPFFHMHGLKRITSLRICPGRDLGEALVWSTIVSLLSVFDLRPAVDAKGKEIPLEVKYVHGSLVK